MKKQLFVLLLALAPAWVFAAGGQGIHLDKANIDPTNTQSLQRGARLFVNYCLSCHSASLMRYERMGKDLGISEELVSENLMFTGGKVGELMKVATAPADAKEWFGTVPPDLTVIARSRASADGSGADWLYTYLRSFYRDDSRPTGWNNTTFANVGMPHVLYELQGEQSAKHVKVADGHGGEKEVVELELTKPGKMSKTEYDSMVGDLVAYLVYMGEPGAEKRRQTGLLVIIGLSVLAVLSYLLKREFWKDIH
jgi:ubiquinol-cytochrome c reductase cytochrome c1 subunit